MCEYFPIFCRYYNLSEVYLLLAILKGDLSMNSNNDHNSPWKNSNDKMKIYIDDDMTETEVSGTDVIPDEVPRRDGPGGEPEGGEE